MNMNYTTHTRRTSGDTSNVQEPKLRAQKRGTDATARLSTSNTARTRRKLLFGEKTDPSITVDARNGTPGTRVKE